MNEPDRREAACEPDVVETKPIRYKMGNDTLSLAARATAPFDLVKFRERIIEASGVTAEEPDETLRDAFDQIKRALHATKVTHHTYKGEITAEGVDTDWRVILKAIKVLCDTFAIAPSTRNTHDPAVVTDIQVKVTSWFDDDAG